MPAGYSSQPISGFTGHMPGAKWQVGSRYIPPMKNEVDNQQEIINTTTNFGPSNNMDDFAQMSLNASQFAQTMPNTQNQFNPEVPHFERGRITFSDINEPINQIQKSGNIGDRTQYDSQVSILRPGSSQMSVGYTAQGMPIRYPTTYMQHNIQPNMDYNFQQQAQHQTQQHQNLMMMPNMQHPMQRSNNMMSEQKVNFNVSNGYPSQQLMSNQPQYSEAYATSHVSNPGQMNQPRQGTQTSSESRSKSMPRRRVEKDPFEGIEGGWWSKGEVLRNKERRELVDRGQQLAGSFHKPPIAPRLDSPKHQWQEKPGEQDDIPAAGYSGHIQGLRQLGIGKSFNVAAKEAKKEYVERRRARSGGREQFYNQSQSNFDLSREDTAYSRSNY